MDGADDRIKQYVGVTTITNSDGIVTPLSVEWADGRVFDIDRVLERRQAHSLRVGGAGVRYTILVGGHTTYLFYDDYRGRWFVEAKRQS